MRYILCALIIGGSMELPGRMALGAERLVLVAGGGTGSANGPATEFKLNGPFGADFDKAGNMFVVEMTGQRVLQVDPKGILTTVAGTGQKGNAGDGQPPLTAQFNGMHSLAVSPAGDVYLADTWNNRVRRFDPKSGKLAAFAGTGEPGFSGDGGPAAKAKFGGVYCLAFDPAGTRLFIDDLDNRRIRAIDMQTGVVTTVAGNGEKGIPADGAEAHSAPMVDPRAVTIDGKGNLYILERSGNALRVVDSAGRIRTVAGTGKPGATGDGGDARQATLNGPKHLCIDLDGNVIIADTENHVIRKYTPRDGQIVRVAGTGKKGLAGLNGPPMQAELSQPHGVNVHPTLGLFIVDSSNDRVLRVEPTSAGTR